MKECALLIMPFFMGYEEALKKELETRYDVTMINCDEYMHDMRNLYYSSKIRRFMRKLIYILKKIDQEKIVNIYSNEVERNISTEDNAYNLIICINGHGVTNKCYKSLKKSNPNARFVLYLWDDVINLLKISHIRIFDERYSYNIMECKRFKMQYLPMFVQSHFAGHEAKDKYDISIIASAHSDRITFAKSLYHQYKNVYKFFIYFYDKTGENDFFSHKEPMTYVEYINTLKSSKVVVDIPNIIQSGPTTRLFDALLTQTKVITTNINILKYPVYSDNILIVDKENPKINKNFIQDAYNETNYQPLYTKEWLMEIKLL